MKILAFSDLHLSATHAAGICDASRDADLVICAGDLCNHRRGLNIAMELLSGLHAPMITVPGNAESAEELAAAALPGTTVLHGNRTAVDGIEIFGLGYGIPTTPFGAWSCDLTDEFAAKMLSRCKSADILITHSPPKGIADQTSAGRSVGSIAIRDAVERIQPKYNFCGHIHDSWGQRGMIERTEVVNLGPEPNWFEV